jgi:hypothetical protein
MAAGAYAAAIVKAMVVSVWGSLGSAVRICGCEDTGPVGCKALR